MYYPKLLAAMAERRITQKDVAEAINVNSGTMSRKLNCKSEFTLKEAVTIMKLLKTDMPLEVLFTMEE